MGSIEIDQEAEASNDHARMDLITHIWQNIVTPINGVLVRATVCLFDCLLSLPIPKQ